MKTALSFKNIQVDVFIFITTRRSLSTCGTRSAPGHGGLGTGVVEGRRQPLRAALPESGSCCSWNAGRNQRGDMGKCGAMVLISFQKELWYLAVLSEELYRVLSVVLKKLFQPCRKGSFLKLIYQCRTNIYQT